MIVVVYARGIEINVLMILEMPIPRGVIVSWRHVPMNVITHHIIRCKDRLQKRTLVDFERKRESRLSHGGIAKLPSWYSKKGKLKIPLMNKICISIVYTDSSVF